MSDKQRAGFEKWINQCNNAGKRDYMDLSMTTNGLHYLEPETDLLWQAWQSAIASVVVELPFEDESGSGFQAGFNSALGEVKVKLTDVGIRYE